MGLTKDYSLAIVLGFLNLLVVPENKRKFIVFSFGPIDSVVFFNIKYVLFLYLLTPFSLNVGAMDYLKDLFHISKKKILGRDTL